jgi:hypothetical protein
MTQRSKIRFTKTFGLLALAAALQCQSVDIFKADPAKVPTGAFTGQDADPLLLVGISGDGVDQQLTVFADGQATIKGHPDYLEKRTCFSTARIQQIRSLFIDNDILNASDHPAIPAGTDALTYDIIAVIGSTTHLVLSTGDRLPPDAAGLIAGIDAIIDDILHDGLVFELMAIDNLRAATATIDFALRVANTGDHDIQLIFPSGLQYDFYIRRMSAQDESARDWNWAQDQVFTEATQALTIRPQETWIFKASWDGLGRDNLKATGPLLLGGMLTSTPGGIAREIPLLISLP